MGGGAGGHPRVSNVWVGITYLTDEEHERLKAERESQLAR